MTVLVRLFAALREAAGAAEVEAAPGSVGEVLDELAGRYGAEFVRLAAISSVMLDGERVADVSRAVDDGAELALLPPVSGGTQDVRDAGENAAPRARRRPSALPDGGAATRRRWGTQRGSQRPDRQQGKRPAADTSAPDGWRPGDESAVPAAALLLGLALVAALVLGSGATAGVILAAALLALLDGVGLLAGRGSRPLLLAAAVPALGSPLLVSIRGTGWVTFLLCLLGGALVALLLLAVARRSDAPEVLAGTAVLGLGVGIASTGLARLAFGPLGAMGVATLVIFTCLAGSAHTVARWLRLPTPLVAVIVLVTTEAAAWVLAELRVTTTALPLWIGAAGVAIADIVVMRARNGRYPRRAIGQGAIIAAAAVPGLAAPVLALAARYLS